MYYFVFDQNNSGGYWIENDDVASTVIIESDSKEDAVDKMEEITDAYSEYCPCCGERWCFDYPSIYKSVVVENLDTQGTALLYKSNGEKIRIPWTRYGMSKYLEAD